MTSTKRTREDGSNDSNKKHRANAAKNWFFTFNNPDENFHQEFELLVDPKARKYLYQLEVGDEGTPHYQGNIEFMEKCRPMELGLSKRMHWEVTKNNKLAFAYCQKLTGRLGNDFKFKGIPRPVEKVTLELLREKRPKMADFAEYLATLPKDNRSIHWLVDREGNQGKTLLCKYIVDNTASIVVGGSRKHILSGVRAWVEEKGQLDYLILDIPRSLDEKFVSYQAIEKVKDGCFFVDFGHSPSMVRLNSPCVVVLSNESPDLSKMSDDRWDVRYL